MATATLPDNNHLTLDKRIDWISSIPFFVVHFLALVAIWHIVARGIGLTGWILLATTFFARMFFITGGYHRYFSHHGYEFRNRLFRAIFAAAGATAAQKGALWWASHHRRHHAYSDKPGDVHSPKDGIWWSHVGWILSREFKETEWERIPELKRDPWLVWIDKQNGYFPWILGAVCFFTGGFWDGLMVGFFLSTVLLWHSTFTINSLDHLWGRRVYDTPAPDTSRNNWILGILTLGEGWHNNHHFFARAARQGFRWWQIDVTYYVLRGLRLVGVTKNLIEPPKEVVAAARNIKKEQRLAKAA